MTYIKWPNDPTSPLPDAPKWPNEMRSPVPYEPNWQNEAMRQNALLHSAMLGGARAEAKLAKAVDIIKQIIATAHADDYAAWDSALDAAIDFIATLEKTE